MCWLRFRRCISLRCNDWKTRRKLQHLHRRTFNKKPTNRKIVERCLSLFSSYVLLYLLCSWGWTINWHWKTCRYVISSFCFQALNEFKTLHSNYLLRTEGNWTPSQMWLNGMLNPSYPTVENLVDNLDDSAEFYGVDWSRATFTIQKQWSLVILNLLNKLCFTSLIYWNLRLKLELIYFWCSKNI